MPTYVSVILQTDPTCPSQDTILHLSRRSIKNLATICPTLLGTRCNYSTWGPDFESIVYRDTFHLQSSRVSCKWSLHFVNDTSATNFTNTTDSSTLFYANTQTIGTVISSNSSPIFEGAPFFLFCDNVPNTFSILATDPDGDSLSYELISPITSLDHLLNPSFAQFASGYSANQPFQSVNSTYLNPQTGQFLFHPESLFPHRYQNSIIRFLVKEHRNGQLIGSSTWTVRLESRDCGHSSHSPFLLADTYVLNQGNWLPISDLQITKPYGQALNLKIEFSDYSINDSLYVSNLHTTLLNSYPNATVQESHPIATNHLVVEISIPQVTNKGFILGIKDNNCSIKYLKTYSITFK